MDIQQTTGVVADEPSLILIGTVLAGMALLSIVTSWGLTRIIKQWRKDHGRIKRLPSETMLTAVLVAATAFMGIWYAAYVFGIIAVLDWGVAGILATITGIAAPLSFNPLLAVVKKRWPHIAAKLEPSR